MIATLTPNAALADRVTRALHRACAPEGGRLCAAEVLRSVRKLRSHTLRLRLTFAGAATNGPACVILKMGHQGSDGRPPNAYRRELVFYREVAPVLPGRLVPVCFEVAEETPTSPWYLLLEDLTDTHVVASEHPLPPDYPHCRRIVQRWGQLHAALWNDPRLAMFSARPPSALWAEHLHESGDRLARFVDCFGEVMPAERRLLYEQLLDAGPRLLQRLEAGQALTLVHGDAHWWNCLVPRADHQEQTRLLDWEDWAVGTGPMDLAYMMAMMWFPERRRATERPLLDCYHETLLAQGVAGYSRQMLGDDYRWSVLLQLLRPIWQATSNLPANVWWPNLERNVLAVEDLDCRELLG